MAEALCLIGSNSFPPAIGGPGTVYAALARAGAWENRARPFLALCKALGVGDRTRRIRDQPGGYPP